MAAAEVMTDGAWWRLGNASTAARFDEPTVCDVDFPTVALTRAEWDGRSLHLTLQAMNDTVAGRPTTIRVTGLDNPAAFSASSPEGAPVEVEVRGADLLVRTTVGAHAIDISLV